MPLMKKETPIFQNFPVIRSFRDVKGRGIKQTGSTGFPWFPQQ
jgi:hypothetical protein